MAYQRLYLPVNKYCVSCGYGLLESGQHRYFYSIDCSGDLIVYAPFDCKVTKLYTEKGHSYEVWLTSTKKVLARNGDYDYFTMSITHPKDIDKLKDGQEFKQGDKVCTTSVMTGVSTGKHAHIELSKGKKAGWEVKHNYYGNINAVKLDKYCFLTEDCIRKQEKRKLISYHIDKESEITKHVTSKDGLNVHKTMDFNKKSTIAEFKYKDDVILLKVKGDYALVYRSGVLGWCASKYIK